MVGTDLEGRRLFIRFGAACLVCQVFVNGRPVGEHRGGFAAFCFDVTPYAHSGSNVLAVRVDNAIDKGVAPLSGDFTVYGGLYREVKLLALPQVSISPTDDGSSGVYLRSSLNFGAGNLDARVALRNDTGVEATAAVRCIAFDAASREVGRTQATVRLAPGSETVPMPKLTVAGAHLWNGVPDPYLYRAVVELVQNGKSVDRIEQHFGFRAFRVDPDRGLILNDAAYDMHGVNLHQGRPSVGWAATRAMQEEDYRLVHELGCTSVRMAHYQHAEHEYELCDRYGLVVWAELALVNLVTDSPEFFDNAKQQLRELIKQNYNHPSILFWSMYNEPAIDKKRGENEWRLVKELNALAKELDPDRLTTGAASAGTTAGPNWYMDVASFNRYWGWYGGAAATWPTNLDKMKDEAAGRSFGISEYGAGASVKQHENNPKQPAPGGKWHPEEYQALFHETVWPALRARPWIWCKLVWVMFDFGSDSRNEGDHPGINDKGLITGDRKIRKDAFFYYRANWTSTPFVYIADRRFNPRPTGLFDLKVYSNCDTVELFLNGRSLGTRHEPEHVFVWPNVDLSGGDCLVEAVGHSGGKSFRDSVAWKLAKDHTDVR